VGHAFSAMNISLMQCLSGVQSPTAGQVPAVQYRAIVTHREYLALASHQSPQALPAQVKIVTGAYARLRRLQCIVLRGDSWLDITRRKESAAALQGFFESPPASRGLCAGEKQ